MVSASIDHTLKLWDLASGREVRTLTSHSNVVTDVAVTPDGQRAVSASHDQTLKVWDLASGRELHTLTGHSSWTRTFPISTNRELSCLPLYFGVAHQTTRIQSRVSCRDCELRLWL